MKDLKFTRTQKLLMLLNDYWNDVAYYDDDLEKEVFPSTEKEVYEAITSKDNEIHLLGAEYIKKMIWFMINDFETFSLLSIKFKAF